MKYKTIYADPPWNEVGGGKIRRGADRHYPLMKTKDIIAMSDFVQDLSEEKAHCYLWVTNNFMEDGFKVLRAWGFRPITIITWHKDRIGLGQYFRGKSEHCLFGVKGNLPYKLHPETGKRMQGVTAFYAPKEKHSQKPNFMREQIEKVSYPAYLELFARQKFKNWDSWGNEVESDLAV